jgi:acyl-CoA reductase-like NAD-dependent aldehyde dehydrogenase
MEPVTLVVTALLAGAGAGVGNVASTAVMDAYQALKDLVRGRLRNAGKDLDSGESLVDTVHASDQDRAALVEALTVADVDEPTRDAAAALLELIESESRARFVVDASQAKGVIIGDHGTQHNTFN